MSLNPARMQNSLKAQLDQDERDLKAELDAVAKAKTRAVKEKTVPDGKIITKGKKST